MKNGFTLIEMLIVMAIFGIIAAVAIPAFTGPPKAPFQPPEFTIECRNGYQYNVPRNYRHSPTQIISENGGGVRCG